MFNKGKTIVLSVLCLILIIATFSCPPGDPDPNPTPTPTTVYAPTPPSDLTLSNSSPCTIDWTDNSDNEDGFNIYIGTSCADCDNASGWILNATVGPNITTYTWTGQTCCSVAECSCVRVGAYNSSYETFSNTIMLAPVCK